MAAKGERQITAPRRKGHEMIRLINKWFLRQSIRKHGVLAPILVTEDGQILDGNTRAEIARELGILIPVAIIPAVHKWMDPQDLKITSPISNRPGAKDER